MRSLRLTSLFLLACIVTIAAAGCRDVRECQAVRVCLPFVGCHTTNVCRSTTVCLPFKKRSVLDEDPARKEDISLASFITLNLDLNEDGVVDVSDWTQAGGPEEDFQVVDLNDDGQLSKDELRETPLKTIPGKYIQEMVETMGDEDIMSRI